MIKKTFFLKLKLVVSKWKIIQNYIIFQPVFLDIFP